MLKRTTETQRDELIASFLVCKVVKKWSMRIAMRWCSENDSTFSQLHVSLEKLGRTCFRPPFGNDNASSGHTTPGPPTEDPLSNVEHA